MTALDSLNQLAQAHIDGIVESHALLFKGVCKRCSEDTKQFFYYIFEKKLLTALWVYATIISVTITIINQGTDPYHGS